MNWKFFRQIFINFLLVDSGKEQDFGLKFRQMAFFLLMGFYKVFQTLIKIFWSLGSRTYCEMSHVFFCCTLYSL